MKVVCIDEGITRKCINSSRISARLIEGKIYTVLKTVGKYYILEELEPDLGYEAQLFIPLSTIDETEMEREIIFKKENCKTH